jgi:hypothetical protein
MKHLQDFEFSGETFDEKIGDPTQFDAALGKIVLSFSFLEDSVRNIICLLLGADPTSGRIVAAALGFRQRLDVMASLVRHRLLQSPDDAIDQDFDEWFEELLFVCGRAEELRNQYIHSSYTGEKRAKTSIRGRRGLKTTVADVDADLVLDVADYISEAGFEVEHLPLRCGMADRCRSDGHSISYLLRDVDVGTFRFGD